MIAIWHAVLGHAPSPRRGAHSPMRGRVGNLRVGVNNIWVVLAVYVFRMLNARVYASTMAVVRYRTKGQLGQPRYTSVQ